MEVLVDTIAVCLGNVRVITSDVAKVEITALTRYLELDFDTLIAEGTPITNGYEYKYTSDDVGASEIVAIYKGISYSTGTPITVSFVSTDTANCNSATPQTYTASVSRKNQTVSLSEKTGMIYNGSAQAANTATTTGNGTISYTYYTNNTCTTKTGTSAAAGGAASAGAAPKNAGTWYVKATASQTDQYNEASSSCVRHKIDKYVPTINISAPTGNVDEGSSNTFTASVSTITGCVGTLTLASADTSKVTLNSGSTSVTITSANIGTNNTITYNGIAYSTGTNINLDYTSTDTSNCANAATKTHTVSVNDKTPPTGSLSTSYSNGVITSTVTVSDSGSGPSGNYSWKISRDSTCDSTTTGFVNNTNSTYVFNLPSKRVYYVCAKISDAAGNYNYVTDTVDATEFDITITNGLIPVTIANDGTVTAVEYDADEWYDYDNQEWANAVLVTSTNRSTYQNIADGLAPSATIPTSDILAYFVYIPRYSYKIWQAQGGMSSQGQEQSINIAFEHQSDSWDTGTTVNSYMTHPAFWWDSDGDGTRDSNEILAGFWASKFNTSISDTSSSCYTSPSSSNCDNANWQPRVLPNRNTMTYMTLSNAFKNTIKLSGGSISGTTTTNSGSSTYGLSSNVYAHISKNREWGGVLYLSHSGYGIDTLIRQNSQSAGKTGCGANAIDSSGATATTCVMGYGTTTTYPQSTTGNISGVFDMSFVYNANAQMAIFKTYVGSSGFASNWLTASGNVKYYDKYTAYSYESGPMSENWGHAYNETYEWYGGTNTTQSIITAWSARSGYLSGVLTPEPFTFSGYNGSAISITTRAALVIT